MSVEHPVLSQVARPPDRSEARGERDTDVHDVWDPVVDRAPRGVTVALVHGGFWRRAYDRTHLAPLAAALSDDGYHVVNLEYPRTGMPGGGWPGTGQALAQQCTALTADDRLPDRMVLVGHSAGGQLALWLASRPQVCADRVTHQRALIGCVALAPAADLRAVHALGLSDGAAQEFLGASPEEAPQVWADADPAQRHAVVPTVVLTGEADEEIPAEVATAYRRSRDDDEPVTFVEVAGADHYDLIDPGHIAYFTLLAHLEQLALDLR